MRVGIGLRRATFPQLRRRAKLCKLRDIAAYSERIKTRRPRNFPHPPFLPQFPDTKKEVPIKAKRCRRLDWHSCPAYAAGKNKNSVRD